MIRAMVVAVVSACVGCFVATGEQKEREADIVLLDGRVIAQGTSYMRLELIMLALPRLSDMDLTRVVQMGEFGEGKKVGDVAVALVLSTIEEKPKRTLLWIAYGYEGSMPGLVRTGALALDPSGRCIYIVGCRSTPKEICYTVGRAEIGRAIAEWPVEFVPEKYRLWPLPGPIVFKGEVGHASDAGGLVGGPVTWIRAIAYDDNLLMISGGPGEPVRLLKADLRSGLATEIGLNGKPTARETGADRK